MGLSSIVDSALDSVESVGETTADVADARLRAITRLVTILIAALVFLTVYAVNAEYALILVGLVIAAIYLLDIDIRGGGGSSGPRE